MNFFAVSFVVDMTYVEMRSFCLLISMELICISTASYCISIQMT